MCTRSLLTVLSKSIFTLATLFLLVACDDNEKNTLPKEVAKLPQGTKIVMVTSGDNPPFESYASQSKQLQGFDIDVMRYIAKELGTELEIKDQDFSTLIASLNTGKASLSLAGLTPTEERKRAVDFSSSYINTENCLVVEEKSGIKSIDYLEKKTIGAQIGSTQAEIAKRIKERVRQVEIRLYNKIGEAIQDVKNGRIQAAIVEKKVAENFTHLGSELTLACLSDEFQQEAAIAFPKNSPLREPIEAVLEKMRQEGILKQLQEKWFGK